MPTYEDIKITPKQYKITIDADQYGDLMTILIKSKDYKKSNPIIDQIQKSIIGVY